MHSFLERRHPWVTNIKILPVETVVDCDFPWMSLMGLFQLPVPSTF